MVSYRKYDYRDALILTPVFVHGGWVGSMYEGCDEDTDDRMIGIQYVWVVGIYILCNVVVDELMVEWRWCERMGGVVNMKQ